MLPRLNPGIPDPRTRVWPANISQTPDPTDAFHLPGVALQRVIADAAVLFAGADPASIDNVIHEAFGQLARALQLDRIVLWDDITADPGEPLHDWISTALNTAEPLPLSALPFIRATVQSRKALAVNRLDEVPYAPSRDQLRQHGIVSAAAMPVVSSRAQIGALAFISSTMEREWPSHVMESLRAFSAMVANALTAKANHQALRSALDDLQQLREHVTEDDLDESRPAVSRLRTSRLIVSESAAIQEAITQATRVAESTATVLLLGETGVGKEVFAQMIHRLSPRHHRQMIGVNCGAIPSALIESELFGRERGAYTGALTRQIGRFEAANQSTLFLDEIGELSAEVQIKLLRVLQERVIERLGSTQQIKVDVRIITATNKNLEKAVEDKVFREDLFYRLNVFPITVPPLRDRIEDIPGLAWEFIDEFSKQLGKTIESISEDSMRQLRLYPWPGNVRELRNVIERAVIVSNGPRLVVPIPEKTVSRPPMAAMTLKNLETEHIRRTLESTHWRIRGRGGAAERLGLKPTTLEGRMAKLGLARPRHA